jgi:hypothetical protein
MDILVETDTEAQRMTERFIFHSIHHSLDVVVGTV